MYIFINTHSMYIIMIIMMIIIMIIKSKALAHPCT